MFPRATCQKTISTASPRWLRRLARRVADALGNRQPAASFRRRSTGRGTLAPLAPAFARGWAALPAPLPLRPVDCLASTLRDSSCCPAVLAGAGYARVNRNPGNHTPPWEPCRTPSANLPRLRSVRRLATWGVDGGDAS